MNFNIAFFALCMIFFGVSAQAGTICVFSCSAIDNGVIVSGGGSQVSIEYPSYVSINRDLQLDSAIPSIDINLSFSDTNIIAGDLFDAAGNIIVVNYSSLEPVPIIPSGWLFLSALNIPAILKLRKIIT